MILLVKVILDLEEVFAFHWRILARPGWSHTCSTYFKELRFCEHDASPWRSGASAGAPPPCSGLMLAPDLRPFGLGRALPVGSVLGFIPPIRWLY